MPTAAKGHACTVLPMKQQEYLGQDVMAFPPEAAGWQFPAAVCELENAASDERVAYSLWKVLCVRCRLRVVFCYRRSAGGGAPLVGLARTDASSRRFRSPNGSHSGGRDLAHRRPRDEADTFPYGFFKAWKLDTNTGRFDRLRARVSKH